MALISRSRLFNSLQLREYCVRIPIVYEQLRWKKVPHRKPTWLPMAPSKVFRIPVHPHVPPDENQLILDLNEEYFRKEDSLRELFRAEIKLKSKNEGDEAQKEEEEEAKFYSLLDENKKENERMRKIREEFLEKLFQEKQLQLLELEEDRKIREQSTKMKVEEIVRKQKIKVASYITLENLDEAVEEAINNPTNINFAIDTNGNIKWEGVPPPEFERELKKQIAESLEN